MTPRSGLLNPALGAAILLGIFLLVVVTSVSTKSATYDESVHIFSGWRILTAGDYATNHEHPPLMKILAALPLTFMKVQPPASQMRREVDEWNVSHEFVYHVNDGDRILAAARFPITLLATILGCVVYRYAAAVFGQPAALAALALFVSEPNILAHSGLVTTDLGITAMTFFTFAAYVGYMRRGGRGRLAGAGVLFGLALLTKFTAILLAPILAVAGAVIVTLDQSRRWRQLAQSLAVVFGIGLLVLNLGYGFGGVFSSLRDFTPESERFKEYAASAFGGVPLPLPLEYVRGFDHAEAGGQRWWSYLFGQHSMTGWRHYYLTALAVKTPLQLLVLACVGLLAWPALVRAGGAASIFPRTVSTVDALLPQVPLLLFLAAFTLSSNLKNIGMRYILPVIPFLCLLGGMATRWRADRLWSRVLMIGLIVWQGAIAVWMYPDYLTFFNLLVGGPSRGSEVLLDSNLDWGQDLKGLGRYIAERRIETIYVDYFGRGCLRYYGVKSTPDFQGGYIAVSATNLRGVYSEQKDRYRFLWGLQPEAVIGRSIFIYNVPRPADWKPKPSAGAD